MSFSFKKLKGRASRIEYAMFFVGCIIAMGNIILAWKFWGTSFRNIGDLAVLCTLCFVAARRCHDLGLSAWCQFIPGFYIYLLFKKGDQGSNRYGPAPEEEDQAEILSIEQD